MRPSKDDGNGSVTLEKLARLAKVSISTVSRALNDHPSISSSTKKELWALARKHGYEFRRHMPASPIGAEGAITVVTPRVRGRPLPLSHPFFLELLASIGEAARDRGCDFTVSHLTPANYEDLVHATTTGRANGVIFLGQGTLHERVQPAGGDRQPLRRLGRADSRPEILHGRYRTTCSAASARPASAQARAQAHPVPGRQRSGSDAALSRLCRSIAGSGHRDR